jgi:hypothetical protein
MKILYFTRIIKTLMMMAPFCSMIVMVFALWGVGGKNIYIDGKVMAKNYMVSGTGKNPELCSTELKNPKPTVDEVQKEKDITKGIELAPEKIDWERVV